MGAGINLSSTVRRTDTAILRMKVIIQNVISAYTRMYVRALTIGTVKTFKVSLRKKQKLTGYIERREYPERSAISVEK